MVSGGGEEGGAPPPAGRRRSGARMGTAGPSARVDASAGGPGGPVEAEGRGRERPRLRRVLSARVPVWVLLVALVVAVILAGLLVVEARSGVHLPPAVGAAQDVDVRMTLCNADVDRLELNPRTAELDLEDVLRSEGARAANVVVEREDCPTTPQPPG